LAALSELRRSDHDAARKAYLRGCSKFRGTLLYDYNLGGVGGYHERAYPMIQERPQSTTPLPLARIVGFVATSRFAIARNLTDWRLCDFTRLARVIDGRSESPNRGCAIVWL
jgi:hypothetical protein